MSLKTANEVIKNSTRRINILGLGGTGKTTFSHSMSEYAGDIIGQFKDAPVTCKDTVVFCGDNEGIKGAMDAGLVPGYVSDLTSCETWDEYLKIMTSDINELLPLVASKQIKVVIVDMALPAQLMIDKVDPTQIKDWASVRTLALTFYNMLGAMKGATIITNIQLKPLTVIDSQKNPDAAAAQRAAQDAVSGGGERNTFGADLAKPIYKIFHENASYTFSRDTKRIFNPMKKTNSVSVKFITHCSPNGRFDAKNRSLNQISGEQPGERTLRSIMKEIYGENL